ncbi:DnaJ domain containing protein [Histomonas meleagridis]|uniref:DnaJ domain containing protein n=1 Tax=Histomonas meleagridis TaxID=135588 RepID=UPI00355A4253|nr:DnaJ domain containing protein [Histomonas meleagridis]KAH0802567.1 DnaJ domain containing protein [Histomonas meleagridis]
MLLSLLILNVNSLSKIESIKKQIKQGKYQAAFNEANSEILKQGTLDAEEELFFLRGQAALKIGKYDDCIKDISRYIASHKYTADSLKHAYVSRGEAYLNLGELDEAKSDADNSKDISFQNKVKKAQLLLNAALDNENSTNYKLSLSKYLDLLRFCTSSSKFYGRAANVAYNLGNTSQFLDLSQKALTLKKNDPYVLELRGKYYLSTADFTNAQRFLKSCIGSASNPAKCTSLLKSSNSFQTHQKSATESITKKDFTTAETHITECNSIVEKLGFNDTPLSNIVKGLKVKVLIARGKKEEAISYMNDLVKASPTNYDLLMQRGELLMDIGDLDGAMSDFQTVRKNSKNNRKVIKLIEKVSDLQEKEKNVDYYTVLGLKHGASIKEVKDAYRKCVIKWHPDRYKDPIKKKEAEKKMKMINRANDVLSDENKKRLYDMGQDPENPMAGGPGPDGGFNGETFNFGGGFPGGFGGFGGFGMFDDIIKQMMGGMGGGNVHFTVNGKNVNFGNKGGKRKGTNNNQRRRTNNNNNNNNRRRK